MKAYKTYFLFIIFGLLTWSILYFGFNFEGLYGQDSYAYAQYAERWKAFLLDGEHPGDYAWPLLYPILGAILSILTNTAPSLSLQLISVIALSSNSYLLYRLLNHINSKGKLISTILSVLLFLSPYYFRSGFVVMSDQLASFFVLFSYFCFYRITKGDKQYIYLLFFAASLSIMTRYPTFILIFLPCILTLVNERKNWKLLLPGLALSTIPFLPHFLIRIDQTSEFLNHGALTTWSLQHFFMSTFETNYGTMAFTTPNVLYILSPLLYPGFTLLGIIAMWRLAKHNWTYFMYITGLSILFYLLFLGGIQTQNMRYFIIAFPLIFTLFSLAISAISVSKNRLLIGSTFLLGSQLLLSGYALSKTVSANTLEKRIAHYFNTQEEMVVYSFGLDVSLQHYCKQQSFITLHEKEQLSPIKSTFLLANESWKHDRLSHAAPGIIYNKLDQEQRLTQIKSFDKGWVLYRIE